MIVVEREDPAQAPGPCRRSGPDGDRAVGRLTCNRELGSAFDVEQSGHDAVAKRPRRIAREPRGERERVRAAGYDRELDRQRSTREASGDARIPSSAARSSASIASWSRP